MSIPQYPQSRPLQLDDKEMLEAVFAQLQPRISELTFANLFLFRNAHAYTLSLVDDSPVVFGKGYSGEAYFLPPLGGDVAKTAARLLGEECTLYGADKSFVERYLHGLEGISLKEDRDSSDYVYNRSDLAELPGNRFHKKKNRISYFTRRHEYRVEPYSAEFRDDALLLLEEWLRVRGSLESQSLLLEAEATVEALKLAEVLGLEGLVVLVEGRVKGLVLGEKLNDTTSLCHFEKADPFMDGLYQLVDREFSRLCFTECDFVNREQDLGEQNLRHSKLSYHPVELVTKYRVSRSRD